MSDDENRLHYLKYFRPFITDEQEAELLELAEKLGEDL